MKDFGQPNWASPEVKYSDFKYYERSATAGFMNTKKPYLFKNYHEMRTWEITRDSLINTTDFDRVR